MSPVMLLTFLCVFSHFVPHINGISNENNFRVMVALHGGIEHESSCQLEGMVEAWDSNSVVMPFSFM